MGPLAKPPPSRATGLGAAKIHEMLAVRASDVLPHWLADTLQAHMPPARSRVMRIYPGKAARDRAAGRWAAFSLEEPGLHLPGGMAVVDAVLLEALAASAPLLVRETADGTRLLACLCAAGDVRYVVELSGAVSASEPELENFCAIASRYYERLADAETDPLTRLSNRRAFHAHVEAGLRRWTTSGRTYFFAVFDIDHFKRVNDGFGHLYGDEILVHFANLMRRTFRSGDLLYRFGGEEFVAIYGSDCPDSGQRSLERFRSAVQAYRFPGLGQVTVSAGFTRIADATTPTATLIDRADQAVYYAKAHGRNRVCEWEALASEGKVEPAGAGRDITLF